MNKRYVALHNLGCKVNAYEMERIAEKLIEGGYTIVPFEEAADYYIINTCTVTNIADRKSRQMLHRARKMNPDAVVIAAGCYVDTHGDGTQVDDGIDIAVPNSEKENIPEIIRSWEKSHNIEETGAPAFPEENDGDRTGRTAPHRSGEGIYTRRFLKVQDGCNMFCSYCIIPYARGRIRSRTIDDVITEVRELAGNGYREFVVTGIHLSSYGKDRPGDKEGLLDLLRAVDGTEGVKRIRLGSLEPRIITESFTQELKEITSLCPQFHLSLQSGSDSVLKRMNRHYTGREYLRSIEILRDHFDDPAITTDVIVGFPGETTEEFEETVEFLRKVKFYETHIFPYSRRKGTPADRMDGQITREEKHRRLKILKELDAVHRREFEERWIGKEAEVLFEEGNEGYTREYIRVKKTGEPVSPGTICRGTLISHGTDEGLEFRLPPFKGEAVSAAD